MTITLRDNLKIWYAEVGKLRGLSEVMAKYTKSYHDDNMVKMVRNFYMLTWFSDYLGEIPKKFLIDNETQQEIAEELDRSYGYVRVAINRFYDKYERDFGEIDVVAMILSGNANEEDVLKGLEIMEDLLIKHPPKHLGIEGFFALPIALEEDFQPRATLVQEKELIQALHVLRGNVKEILESKIASVPKEVREYVMYLLTEEVSSGREKEEQKLAKEVLWYDGFN